MVAQPAIGVSTFLWYSPLTDVALEAIGPKLKEWGFDAIELPLEKVGDWDATRARQLLGNLGLRAVVGAVMPPGRELVHASDDVIAATQKYLLACVDTAVELGSEVVTGPVYASVGRCWRLEEEERAEAVRELRANLEGVVAYAAKRGVRFGLEPLNRYETSLINTAEQAYEVVEPLPAEGIGLTLDTYHMNIEERNSAEAIRLADKRLVYMQLCGNDRGAPGRDQVDWDGIGRALVEVGYSGIASIESFTPTNVNIARAASIWRPLGRSQDDIAIDGLRFLRQWCSWHW